MTNSNQATDTQTMYTIDPASYTHDNSELSSAVIVLLTRIEELEARLDERDTQIAALTARIDERDAVIADLTNRIQTLEGGNN